MRKLFTTIAACWALLSGAAAVAQENLVVVELYTSAGCSSCPPADALLTKLAKRDDVLALALHVDYWDYIGWKDQFGSPQFSDRQRHYARFAHRRAVYTPQMIIGGVDDVVGSKPMEVADLINAKARAKPDVNLQVTRQGGKVLIGAAMTGGSKGPMVVQLVRYVPSETVNITRGENAGRRIEYSNIVTEWHEIGQWNGASPLKMSAKVSGAEPVVVIVQARGPGRILAAARLR
jgi:hypothetical protein